MHATSGRIASFVSIFSFAALAGCAAPTSETETADESSQSANALAAGTLAGGATYVRLEQKTAAGAYVLSRVNGGKLDCPTGPDAKTCTVDKLVLPADCTWECQDGLLSLQGVSVLRGAFQSTYDATAHRKVTSFTAASGFDTYDSSIGSKTVYRVTSTVVQCFRAPCPARLAATTVNATTSKAITSVDFSTSHDPNYVLDPSRGIAQMARPEGLLVSGTIVNGVFKADRVWRQWTPEADCDVLGAARAYYFTTPPAQGEVNLEFATTLAAESYADPQGRTVKWLVRTSSDALAIEYTGGVNDLWAQTFTVDTHTCGVTLTGEH